jgi:glutathione S-transferase
VCARIRTYGLPLGAAASAYVERVHALPAMQAWCAAARDEHEFIEDDEPYRQRV